MSLIPRNFDLDDFFDIFPKLKQHDMRCDIYEKDGKYNIEMDIMGFTKKDIKIESKDGYLIVRASKETDADDDKNYIRRERLYGKYERSFYIGEFNDEDVKAEFKEGVLKIVVPRKETSTEKKYINID